MTFNKNKLRKVLVLALSLFMIPTQVHAENGSGTDITTKWYSEIVSDMFARGIISDTVGLEEPLTRGNMAEILIATGKFSDNTYAVNPFTDLSVRDKEYANIIRLYNSHAAKADDKVTLVTEGTNVSGKDFANPAVLKIPADTKDVKNVKNLTLAKLNAETGKLEIVGGSYDAKANAVVGYVAEEGSYFVVEKEGLTTISMQIGNKHVALNNENKILDAAPLISQNRTMVPLRFIAEAFGADVSWAQDTKTVTIVIDGKVLTMRINQDLEGFGAAPIISSGRTMVPISYISKELGANVIWVPSTKTVAIAR